MLSVINFSSDPVLKENLKLQDKKSITYKGQEIPITWTSSDLNVLTNEGEIVEFEGENRPVTMTATVTTEIEGQTVTVELKYNFMVAPTQVFATIKETMKKDLIDKTVVVGEVSLYKKVTDKDGAVSGYYLVDSEGTLAYVNGNDLKGIEENKKYKLKAVVGQYYGAMQYSVLNVTELGEGKFAALAVEKTITDITSLPKPSANNPALISVLYKLTNVKVFSKGTGNYDLKLALAEVTGNDGLTSDNSITVYYKSNKEVLDKLVGKTITEIHIINRGYRSDQNTWYVDFIGTADDIELSLTDDEKLDLALEVAKQHITSKVLYKPEHDANFGQIKFKGVTFEFTSDDTNIVDNTGKVVNLPAALQDLNIHVVAKLANNQQKTGDYKLKVGQLLNLTIDQTYALNKGDYAIVEAVVTKDLGSGNYAVQDETSVKGGNLRPNNIKVEVGKKYKFITKLFKEYGLSMCYSEKILFNGDIQKGFNISPDFLNPEDKEHFTWIRTALANLYSRLCFIDHFYKNQLFYGPYLEHMSNFIKFEFANPIRTSKEEAPELTRIFFNIKLYPYITKNIIPDKNQQKGFEEVINTIMSTKFVLSLPVFRSYEGTNTCDCRGE